MKKLFFSFVIVWCAFSLCAAEKEKIVEDIWLSVVGRDANEPPFKFEKGKAYLIEFDLCKKPKEGFKPQDDVSNMRMGVELFGEYDEKNEYIEVPEVGAKFPVNSKIRNIAEFGVQAPIDGQKHHVSAAVEIPKDVKGEIRLGAFNTNRQVWLDVGKITVTELPPQEKIVIGPAKIEQKVAEKKTEPTKPADVVTADLGPDGILTVVGDGMFRFANRKVPIAKGMAYTISCELRKEGELSANPIEHRLVMLLLTPQNKVQEFCYLGENVPTDGQWHRCNGSFTTPSADGEIMFYLYNVHGKGTVQLRNLVFSIIKK